MGKQPIFVCRHAERNCYALTWSYGEICVGCHCCGPPSLERTAARLRYSKALLKESLEFDQWDKEPKLRALQERNVRANVRHAKRRVAYYGGTSND